MKNKYKTNDPDMWLVNESFMKRCLRENKLVEFNFAADYTARFVIDKINNLKLKHSWCGKFNNKYFDNEILRSDAIVTGFNMKTMDFIYE